MADGSSSFRAVLILIIAAILIIATFSFLTVVYPTGPSGGNQSGGPFQLFETSYNDSNGLGANITSFTPGTRMNVLVEGYMTNRSNGNPLADLKLIVAVYPEETVTLTGSTGYYYYFIRYTGNGSFAYKIPGYETAVVNLTAASSTVWENVSLNPSPRYQISGSITDIYGNRIADIRMNFTNFYETAHSKSNSTGFFSIWLYNESYEVTAYGYGYHANVTNLTVLGAAVSKLDIVLNTSLPSPFSITGFAHNTAGNAVDGAVISTYPIVNATTTNATGFFALNDLYGSINISTNATGFNESSIRIPYMVNNTSLNFTLDPVASIGSGLGLFNSSRAAGTGDPTVNLTTLLSSLSPYEVSASRSAGTASIDVTLSSGSTVMNNTSFLAYVDSNGILYRGLFATNSAGQAALQLNYTGYYGLAILTLYGGINASGVDFLGTKQVVASFPTLLRHNLSIQAVNAFNNISIPGTGFSCANSLLPVAGYFVQVSNTTYFNYTLPGGDFLMSYSNPGFANASFYANVTGNDTTVRIGFVPYIVQIFNEANLTWNVTLYTVGYEQNVSLPTGGNLSLHVFAGNFVIQAVALNGNFMVRAYVNTTSYLPVGMAYLNQTYGSESVNVSSSNCTSNVTAGVMSGLFQFNFTVSSLIMLMGVTLLALNFTPLDSTFSAESINVSFSGSSLNFTPPSVLVGGMIRVSFVSSGLSAWQVNELCKLLTIRIDYSYVVVTVEGRG